MTPRRWLLGLGFATAIYLSTESYSTFFHGPDLPARFNTIVVLSLCVGFILATFRAMLDKSVTRILEHVDRRIATLPLVVEWSEPPTREIHPIPAIAGRRAETPPSAGHTYIGIDPEVVAEIDDLFRRRAENDDE